MNKELYGKALSHYICNVEEILDSVVDNNDWRGVELFEPFEYWKIKDIKELVDNLYKDFTDIIDTKPKEKYLFFEIYKKEKEDNFYIKYPRDKSTDLGSIVEYINYYTNYFVEKEDIEKIEEITGTDYILDLLENNYEK